MIDGDSRNAEGPQGSHNSSINYVAPAEAVPYMGSSRINDWSLHGSHSAVIRLPVRAGLLVVLIQLDGHDDSFAQQSADHHLPVRSV